MRAAINVLAALNPQPRGVLKPVLQGRSPDSRAAQSWQLIDASCTGCAAFPRVCVPAVAGLCAPPRLPLRGQYRDCGNQLAAHLIPVSSTGRDRLADTLQQSPDQDPAGELYPAGFWLPSGSSKIMNDIHKRPLLLDAAENLPL